MAGAIAGWVRRGGPLPSWVMRNAGDSVRFRRTARAAPGPDAGAADAEIPDDVLVERVRERASIPDGVEVAMTEGAVVLFGRIMRAALVPLLERVSKVEGVTTIENRLTPVEGPFERPPS